MSGIPPHAERENVEWRVARTALILALGFLLVATAYLFAAEFRALRTSGVLVPVHRPREILRAVRPQAGTAAAPPNVDLLQSWMTFDYVNKVFGAPPQYLKGRLGITDGRYPALSFARYARRNHLQVNDVLDQVKAALKEFVAAKKEKGTAP